MSFRIVGRFAAGCGLVVLMTAMASGQGTQVLKKEPPMGALKTAERALVDDGSCPKGQIKEVIGGQHVGAGARQGSRERQRRCIPR